MSVPVLSQANNQWKYNCAALEAAFTGYRAIASDVMKSSWVTWPLRPLVIPGMPKHIDPIDHVGAIRHPLLILHSKDDEIIPYSHGKALFEAASEPKELQPLKGNHIAAMQDPAVRKRLTDFIGDNCGINSAKPVEKSVPIPVPDAQPVAPETVGPAGISF
jgi:alpha-beta hydrolase superfamily lysophospholipase